MPEREEKQQNALATQSIPGLILRYAAPSIVSMLVMSLYNIADQIFIGRGVGFLGNAATTVAFPLMTVGLGFALLTGIGASACISLELGRGESAGAQRTLGNAMLALIALSLAVAIVPGIFLKPLLRLLGSTDAIMPYAADYAGIILIGMPFSMCTVMSSHIIRADGSPRYSMLCTLSGAVLNTVLDPIFIFIFRWGVKGVAVATVISQTVSFSLALYYLLYRAKYVRISVSAMKPDAKLIKKIFGLGLPSFLNQVLMVFVMVALNRSLVRYGAQSPYGSEIPLAALGVITKINMILISVILGVSIGLQPIIGFNYGAKLYGRVKRTFRIGVTVTGTIALIGNILFITVPQAFIGIFGDADYSFNSFACLALSTYMGLIVAAGVQIPSSQFFTSIGKPFKAMMLTSGRSLFAHIPLLLILPLFFGIKGILYSNPAADAISFLVTMIFITKEMKSIPGNDGEITGNQ